MCDFSSSTSHPHPDKGKNWVNPSIIGVDSFSPHSCCVCGGEDHFQQIKFRPTILKCEGRKINKIKSPQLSRTQKKDRKNSEMKFRTPPPSTPTPAHLIGDKIAKSHILELITNFYTCFSGTTKLATRGTPSATRSPFGPSFPKGGREKCIKIGTKRK